jgi:hypothetical protein
MTHAEHLAARVAPYYSADYMRAEIAAGIKRTFGHVRVLSIDAWRDGNGWTWNNWFPVGWFPLALIDLPPRALLRELRARSNLTGYGLVTVEDDGYNVVVTHRGTGEPLVAIEYGV